MRGGVELRHVQVAGAAGGEGEGLEGESSQRGDGDGEAMTNTAYNAWRADRDAGLVSVLIAEHRLEIKDLSNGEQHRVALDDVVAEVRRLLG